MKNNMIVPKFIKEVTLYGSGRAVLMLFSLITLPIMTRFLTPSDFGLLMTISIVTGFIILIFSAGDSSPMVRYYSLSENDNEKVTIVTTWYTFSFVILTFVFCFIFFFKENISLILINTEYPYYLVMAYSASMISYLSNLYLQLFRFRFQSKRYVTMNIFSVVLNTSLSILALISGLGVKGVLFAQLVSAIVVHVLYLYLSLGYIVLKEFSLNLLTRLLKYGIPLVPAAVLWQGLNTVDRIMLFGYSPEQAGLYAIAFKVCTLVVFTNVAFGTAWSPRAFEVYKKNPSKAKIIYAKILHVYLSVMFIMAIVITAFAKEGLFILAPSSYVTAASLVGGFAICIICDGSTYITQIPFGIKNKTHLMIIPPLIAFVVNIILNYLLIPKFGMYGALLGSTISFLFLAIIYGIVGNRIFPIFARLHAILFMILSSILIIITLMYLWDFHIIYRLSLCISGILLVLFSKPNFSILNVISD